MQTQRKVDVTNNRPVAKSHNSPVPYLTMSQFVTEICTLQNSTLWNMYLKHCEIGKTGLLETQAWTVHANGHFLQRHAYATDQVKKYSDVAPYTYILVLINKTCVCKIFFSISCIKSINKFWSRRREIRTPAEWGLGGVWYETKFIFMKLFIS